MRIVHISTSDAAGGAARAAHRVHEGLRRLGHDSSMLVGTKWSIDTDVRKFVPSRTLIDRFRQRQRRQKIEKDFDPYKATRPPTADPFIHDWTEFGGEPYRDFPEADIITLHWVAKFLDYGAAFRFFASRPNVPLTWRLADMGPLTGGCLYDQDCGKFTQQCGACPMLGSTRDDDLSRQSWRRRHDALSLIPTERMHLVATSRWIAAQAAKSSLLGRFGCTIIPNALDADLFKPRDKAFSRDMLNIPQNARVVLFAADSVKDRRKGFAELSAALAGIQGMEDLVCVSIGSHQQPVPSQRVMSLGKISEDRIMSMAYSAADLFVIPSLQESFGQTVIEAMACGTPVVGFASGGIADTIRHDRTGLLVPTGDVNQLREAIVTLLSDAAKRASMGNEGRRVALEDYTFDVQARQYEKLYEACLAKPPQR